MSVFQYLFESTGMSGLATQTSASSIPARSASSKISRIPVLSQNIVSSIVAIPAQSSTLLQRHPVVASVAPASMPKKTESSILAHVKRLRRTRQAQTTYKTSTAFKKSVSKPVQLQSTSRPVSRVPSTTSIPSSSSSAAARTERSVEAHIQRVSGARVKSTPVSSSRPTPVNSRKITPVQPLLVKKVVVDRAQVSDKLAGLSVAPLVVAGPVKSTLRSCLKTSAATRKVAVHFIEYGGWNIHGIRTFQPESPPTTFISPSDAEIVQPLHRQVGTVEPGSYQLVGQTDQIRWPPTDDGPKYRGYDSLPSPRCGACASIAARGTSVVRYRPQQQSVWCAECMASPTRRPYFTPALDDDGLDDEEDNCPSGLHHHYPESCAYFRNGFKANVLWLYERYPERYAALNAILDE